jgi:hypothetical protein
MEVRLFPNAARPGVGLAPRRESQRPLLPQHARHCPVLEAGSALGYLVYPPLESNESFQVEYLGDGQYKFLYFMSGQRGKWQSIFSIKIALPLGSVGMTKADVEFLIPNSPISKEGAMKMAGTFIVLEDLGTPAGGVTLRGATNFETPPGWDTVYAPIFNMIERPIAPMLVVRVETDWFPHDTEFRYVLQAGEAIPAVQSMPIGQVFFVPREDVTLRDGTDDEMTRRNLVKQEFLDKKAAHRLTTRYGFQYSPHYARQSRSRKLDDE